MSRTRRIGTFIAAFVALCLPRAQAQAQDTSDCIDGAVTLPLLGGRGDSPILPATLDGKEIALYFSSAFDALYVGDMEGFETEDTHKTLTITTNRAHTRTRPVIRAGHLRLGSLDLQTPDMIRLDDYPIQHIGSRPLIGTIGSTFFDRLTLLLDMPHGVFAVIHFQQDPVCSRAPSDFIGAGAQVMSLSGNDSITAKIEGRDREMTLDSDVPVTTLPARWLSGSERNDTNPTIALYGALRTRLFRTTVSSFRIGDITLDGMSAYAQQDLGVGLLGVDFFQSHMVLFDYPNRKVYLRSARSQITRAGTGLHFDRIREGQTHVSERP